MVWLSGALWLFARFFLARQGPFGREPHPLESWMPMCHGAAAFAMLWLFGWLWAAHVRPWWTSGKRRSSGVLLIVALAGLTVSGHLLYYVGEEALRQGTSILHWAVGLASIAVLVAHAVGSRRQRRRRKGDSGAVSDSSVA
jgi:Na+/proline symporter